MFKKLTALIMASTLTFASLGLVACGDKGGSSTGNAFTVVYYPGGYGSEWLDEFVKEFVAEKRYGGDVSKVTSSDYKLTAREDVGSASTIILKSRSSVTLSAPIESGSAMIATISPATTSLTSCFLLYSLKVEKSLG